VVSTPGVVFCDFYLNTTVHFTHTMVSKSFKNVNNRNIPFLQKMQSLRSWMHSFTARFQTLRSCKEFHELLQNFWNTNILLHSLLMFPLNENHTSFEKNTGLWSRYLVATHSWNHLPYKLFLCPRPMKVFVYGSSLCGPTLKHKITYETSITTQTYTYSI
jgi:hypothetical protein